MQLYNTTQYAIRILSYITHQDKASLCNAKNIADALEIPYKFLTKIMRELVVAGFIRSIRGREGGYILSKPASEIALIEILNIFNDSLNDEYCILGIGFCDSENKCALHDQWNEPKSLIQNMFKNTTLKDLIDKGNRL